MNLANLYSDIVFSCYFGRKRPGNYCHVEKSEIAEELFSSQIKCHFTERRILETVCRLCHGLTFSLICLTSIFKDD